MTKTSMDFKRTLTKKPIPISEKEWVRNVKSSQPPLFDIIELNPGVSATEGNRSKRSAKPVHRDTMTRQ